ncbi:MAG TPA: hypothetical protein PKA95_05335, partial [Thermomicrobiales bacterium]|nr:hypothetical protein [Thermomicrobiales bacterium]
MSTESTNSNPTLTQPEPSEERSAADRLEQLIHAQPELVSTAITANFDAIRESATLVAAARRVRLAGAGHSAAVAEVGEHLLRSVGIDARATHAFDLATYPPGFDASDLLVAVASGEDRAFASRAVQRASHAGLPSVAGEYLANGDIQYIQFWDPAVAGYAMNILAVAALEGKGD